MRIVVPISKALFEKMKSNKNHIEDLYYYDIRPAAEAVSKGKPLTNKDTIKELEEIKAEIDRLYAFYMYIFKENVVIKSDVMQILDKHIAELKGEDK